MAESEKPKGPVTREIATTDNGRDITRLSLGTMGTLMPPQDSVLQARGEGHRIYEDILRDDQVASAFQQRRLSVVSRSWDVVAGDNRAESQKAADFLKEMLTHIRWDTVTDRMLYGVFYGYSVSECMWAREGAHVVLDQLKVRKQRRFGFGYDGKLRLLTDQSPEGELLPEQKFWSFCTGADNDDEPYGLGLGHWLYWPVFFKRGGVQSWTLFLDKFSMPTVKGSYPSTATDVEKRTLLSSLAAVQSSAGIMLPKDMEIELLAAAQNGVASYADLMDRMNAAIAKVILSQTQTTDSTGGQFKSEVQKSVRNEVVKADSDLVCDSFNRTVGKWLTQWNYPNAAVPFVRRELEDPEDLNARSQRDERLSKLGFRPTLECVEEVYGGKWELMPAANSKPAKKDSKKSERTEFSEDSTVDDGGQNLVDALYGSVTDEVLQGQVEGILKPVFDLLQNGMQIDDATEKLAEIYPLLDDSKLEDVLTRLIFFADVIGRADVGTVD